jgi:phosphoribosylformylglycinamidine (FGAM) synthase-like amidotransferase family enzyme
MLPRSHAGEPQLLTWAGNDSLKFECRWIYLRANETSCCVFTWGVEVMYLLVADREGKVVLVPGTVDGPRSLSAELW